MTINGDDICLWPNGDWCYGDDLEDHLRTRSDDFEVLPFGSEAWERVEKD